MAHPQPGHLYTVHNPSSGTVGGHFLVKDGTPPTFELWDADGVLHSDGTLMGGPPSWGMVDGQGQYMGEFVASDELPVMIHCDDWPNNPHHLT